MRSSLKIISQHKKIGYNINVLQQTACLMVSPIMVSNFAFHFNCMPVGRTSGNFAFLFNCTPVGRTSDSMTVPTWTIVSEYDQKDLSIVEMVEAWCFGCL